MEYSGNRVTLSGVITGEKQYSHTVCGEDFYQCFLEVERLSGAVDCLPLTVSARILAGCALSQGEGVTVTGQLRSYNKQVEGVSRLILTVFVQHIGPAAPPRNEIRLTGYVCKPPVFRVTPFSREIADLLLAVNRQYGKSDYIPCIAWGRNARFASGFSVGTRIQIWGRVQSREYTKKLSETECEKRTAYEVSVSKLECCQ